MLETSTDICTSLAVEIVAGCVELRGLKALSENVVLLQTTAGYEDGQVIAARIRSFGYPNSEFYLFRVRVRIQHISTEHTQAFIASSKLLRFKSTTNNFFDISPQLIRWYKIPEVKFIRVKYSLFLSDADIMSGALITDAELQEGLIGQFFMARHRFDACVYYRRRQIQHCFIVVDFDESPATDELNPIPSIESSYRRISRSTQVIIENRTSYCSYPLAQPKMAIIDEVLKCNDCKLVENLQGQIEFCFQSLSRSIATTQTPFMLLGGRSGNGKSTLICAIAKQIGVRVLHVAFGDLLIAATGRQSLSQLLQLAINCAIVQRPCILILKDIHTLLGNAHTRLAEERSSQIDEMETV